MSVTTAAGFAVRIPFVERLGLRLHAYGDGAAEVRIELAAEHLNTWQVAHGGVLMTMLDVAMAQATRSALALGPTVPAGQGPGVATVEMKTSFVRPAEGPLRAAGRVLHRSATLAFCEAAVYDAQERLCAHATGTFKVLRALATAERKLRTEPSADPDPETTA